MNTAAMNTVLEPSTFAADCVGIGVCFTCLNASSFDQRLKQ